MAHGVLFSGGLVAMADVLSLPVVLAVAGAVFAGAAIIGGGLKIKGDLEIPELKSPARWLLGVVSVLMFAGALWTYLWGSNDSTPTPSPTPTLSLTPPTSPTPPPTSPPTSPPSPRPSTPPPKPAITVSCVLVGTPRPGGQVIVRYRIVSTTARVVDLGAGLYDESLDDKSTGFGDLTGYHLVAGPQTPQRPVKIPANLRPGTYELTAEVWPPGTLGVEGKDSIADSTCTSFTVR